MKTQIFKDYLEFCNRADKDLNGVTQEFANSNPNWAEEKNNKGCWNCYDCYGCSRCSDCYDCYVCYVCYVCYGLSNTDNKENADKAFPEIPKIDNIHQKIFAAVSNPGALEMGDWHSCDTTHCRAGWVVHLAGELGKKLEDKTSTAFAAMQILKVSSHIRVYPNQFCKSNKQAMEDIERCANEEKAIL